MAKTTQQVWNNLNLLKAENPYSTFRRQRMYLEDLMNREDVQDNAKRQAILQRFGLHDKLKPADTSYEDTLSGFAERAFDRGGEQIEQIYEGMKGYVASQWLDDPEMYKESREAIKESQREASRITQVQEQFTDNSLERWVFDASGSLPVMGVALAGSALAAAALTTVKIPAFLAGIIGYGLVDAMIEAGANFGDVITHPRMMKALEDTLGRKPTETELSNISEGVGRELAKRAGSSAQKVAVANLFNPINIVESRMKLLGGGGWAKRLGKRAVIEGVEEGGQSVVSQAARESEIGEVSPRRQRPVDKGEALYEASLGAATGPIISLPQTYAGIRADRREAEMKQAQDKERELDWGTTDPAQAEVAKDQLRKETANMLNQGDLEDLDRVFSDASPGKQDVMAQVINDAKTDQQGMTGAGRVRSVFSKQAQKTAREFKPGTHIPEDSQKAEGAGAPKIGDWQFKLHHQRAERRFEEGNPSPRDEFILAYAAHVDNPSLTEFERRWKIEQKTREDLQEMEGGEPEKSPAAEWTQTNQSEITRLQQEIIALQREQLRTGRAKPKAKTQQQKLQEELNRLKAGQDTTQDVEPDTIEDPATTEETTTVVDEEVSADDTTKKQRKLPEMPADGLMDGNDWRKGMVSMFDDIIGNLNRNTGTKRKLVTRAGKKVEEDVDQNLTNRINSAASRLFPRKGAGSRPFKTRAGLDKTEPLFNSNQANFVAKGVAVEMHSEGWINGSELELIRQAIDGNQLQGQFTGQNMTEVTAPVPEEDTYGIDEDVLNKEDAATMLRDKWNFDERLADDIVNSLPDEFTFEELRIRANEMSIGDPRAETEADRQTSAAVSDIIAVITDQESRSPLNTSFTLHVENAIRRDDTLTNEQKNDSRVLSNKKEDLAREMARDYIAAVNSITPIENDMVPSEYLTPKRIRGVFNLIFGGAKGMYLSRPRGYDKESIDKGRTRRIEEIAARLLDEDYRGMSQGQMDLSKGLKLDAARDAEGMAFVDTEGKLIPAEGAIPEGAVILETKSSGRTIKTAEDTFKDVNRITFWVWSGQGQALKKRRDMGKIRAFGYWYKARPGEGDNFNALMTKEGQTSTKHKNTPHWNLPENFYQEVHFAQDNDQMGLKLSAAYLQLTDPNFEGNFVRFNKNIYTVRGSGRFERPDIVRSEGRWSDEQMDAKKQIQRNNTLKREFDNLRTMSTEEQDAWSEKMVAAINTHGRDNYGDVQLEREKGTDVGGVASKEQDTLEKAMPNVLRRWQTDVVGAYDDGLFLIKAPGEMSEDGKIMIQAGVEPTMRHFGFVKKGDATLSKGLVSIIYESPKYQRDPFKEKDVQGPQPVDTDAEIDAVPERLLPEILKEFIKERRALSRTAFDKLVTTESGDNKVIQMLSPPDSLKPSPEDTQSIADAKRKLMDSIFTAVSSKFTTDQARGQVEVMADIPKLWMAMKILKKPGAAEQAQKQYLQTREVKKSMSDEEMRTELETIDTMIMGINGLESQQAALVEYILENTDELADVKDAYYKLNEDYTSRRAEIIDRSETDYDGVMKLTKDQAIKALDELRVEMIQKSMNIGERINIEGNEQKTADLRRQLNEVNDKMYELMDYSAKLDVALEESQRRALEKEREAAKPKTQKAKDKKAKKEEQIDELYEIWGKNTKLLSKEDIKADNGILFRGAVTKIQSALYDYAKKKTSVAGANSWAPKANSQELLDFVQDFIQLRHKDVVLGIDPASSSQYGPGIILKGWDTSIYNKKAINPKTGEKDMWGPQWAKNAVGKYILENPIKGAPLTEAEITPKGDVPLNKDDVLMEADPDNVGYLDYTSRAISPSQIMGQLGLTDKQSEIFQENIEAADFWSDAPDNLGIDFDGVINSKLDWSKPAKSEQKKVQDNLNEDHALKVISESMRLTGKSGWYTSANKIFNDTRRLTYEYLKGLTKYGSTAANNDGVLTEIQKARGSDLITDKQMATLDSMFKKAMDEETLKKKL